jgi:hypothetical protein
MRKKKPIISSYKICKKCNLICYTRRFQQNFKNWSSGDDDIDDFIQDTQLSSHDDIGKALEWISYDKFYDIEYIAEGRQRAKWIDGVMIDWNSKNQNWERKDQNMNVELESINNPKNISLKLTDKV